MDIKKITNIINTNIEKISEHSMYKNWSKEQTVSRDDLIMLNNSFIYRDTIKTNKSEKYLCLKIGSKNKPKPLIEIGTKCNTNFKIILKKSQKALQLIDLGTAVKNEIENIGELVFVLIGDVRDNVVVEEPFNSEYFETISLDPVLEEQVIIKNRLIRIKDAKAYETIWDAIKEYLGKNGKDEMEIEKIKAPLDVALKKIEDKTHAILDLDLSKLGKSEKSIIHSIVKVLGEQIKEYETALSKYKESKLKDGNALSEILRIAYNFAHDVITFLRLMVSICDLKPIIMWCTLDAQHELSEAFRNLPWARLRYKPSFKNYIKTIGDARNSSFHDLIPFKKTIEVRIPSASLRDVTISIFPEYNKKKDDRLDYKDKEMVQVLSEFTRAAERNVAFSFWEKNLHVMKTSVKFISGIETCLKALLALK